MFLNCPYDPPYADMLEAAAFTVVTCGFTIRLANDTVESGVPRLQRITALLERCGASIHDLSRLDLDEATGLPRFNMPIELGMALGMQHLGRDRLRDQRLLIMDADKLRYRDAASDLAGIDIEVHGGNPSGVVRCVRAFLAGAIDPPPPGPAEIGEALKVHRTLVPELAAARRQRVEELTVADRLSLMNTYLLRAQPA